jgi:hypothetical protein
MTDLRVSSTNWFENQYLRKAFYKLTGLYGNLKTTLTTEFQLNLPVNFKRYHPQRNPLAQVMYI